METTAKKESQEKTQLTGPRYWKSLDEYAETPEFKKWVENEFPQGASEAFGVNRRQFMKVMGASFAFAGLGMSACRRPEQKIVPYAKQPENMIPGVSKYFATALPDSADGIPLIVETHSSRPTKIEGNGNYKPYRGATDSFAQASILDLYDPSRAQKSKSVDKDGNGTDLTKSQANDILNALHHKYSKAKGQGLALLIDGCNSPSRKKLLNKFKDFFPEAVIADYEPVDHTKVEKALKKVTGKRLRPHYHFENAKRIVSLDSDFLSKGGGSIGNVAGWSKSRKVKSAEDADQMNRLYQIESDFTVTGGMADHRLRLATSDIPAFTAALANQILSKAQQSQSISALSKALKERISAQGAAKAFGFDRSSDWLSACAEDLLAHKGKSVLVAGDHLPAEVHQLVLYINQLLDAVGKTVDYLKIDDENFLSIRELASSIENGQTKSLVVLNGNPVYDAPADLKWSELQSKLKASDGGEVIHFSYYFNETSKASNTHVAAAHYLESWGDSRTWTGTILPVQPMIQPIFPEVMMELEFLATLCCLGKASAYSIAKSTFTSLSIISDKDKAYNRFLNRGFHEGREYSKFTGSVSIDKLIAAVGFIPRQVRPAGKDALEVRIVPSSQVFDGRYNNNAWLQEVPEPMNKTTWENTINISPQLAKDLNFEAETVRLNALMSKFPIIGKDVPKVHAVAANTHLEGKQHAPVGRITVNGVTIEGPVNVQPGLNDYTITVAMGYGRTVTGQVGEGSGFDVFPLWNEEQGGTVAGAKLELLEKVALVANTQQHWSMEGRAIIREANVETYKKDPKFVDHMGAESHSPPIYGKDQDKPLSYKATTQPRGKQLYKTPAFKDEKNFKGLQQWGMAIDLNTCTGCNQCVIACQSENNIPTVGKSQVLEGREMHWMRLDRYYVSGEYENNKSAVPSDPQVVIQPMACQQCELAPCEQVCPVNATVHDEQGINVMAYNRCVGTRYCSNNCPYKVRRFNFFDWNKRYEDEYYNGNVPGMEGTPLGARDKNESTGGKLKAMVQNPNVTVRMRGVMEKCNYCQQRIEEAKINQKVKAGSNSGDINIPDGTIKVACQQACAADAITFGDIADETTEVYKVKQSDRDYDVLGYLNIRPRTTYLARLRNPNPKMPDYHKKADDKKEHQPLSTKEYKEASGGHDHH